MHGQQRADKWPEVSAPSVSLCFFQAFFSGKLKIKGNVMLGQKLELILKDFAKL